MEYSSLDFARFETRFLRLAAPIGDADDQLLRFHIEIGSVRSPPPFQALSYCWGQELGKGKILVAGTEVKVSTNLEAALRSSALAVSALIWVDAICINQEDPHEKSYQVRMMGQIYSRATKVIAWLGEKAPYSHAAARLVKEMTRMGIQERNDLDWEKSESPILKHAFEQCLAYQRSPPKVLEGLAELFSRSYWERVWIIQEVAKASVVIVRCGNLVMDLHTLLRLKTFCRRLSHRTRTLLASVCKFRAQELRNSGRMSLVQALITSRSSVSSDERDKVYALLGLADDGVDLVPLPTYVMSAPELFEELTRKMIESHEPSSVLLLARRCPLMERFPGARPWCVDWVNLELNIPDWVAKSSFPANDTRRQPHPAVFENSTLHVQGHRIGRITSYERDQTSWASRTFSERDRSFNIIQNLALDIINRLSGSKVPLESSDGNNLVYALSRMIRDEEKAVAFADYNLSRISSVLNRLGGIQIDNMPILEWARTLNACGPEKSGKSTNMEQHVAKRSPQISTLCGGAGVGRLLQTMISPWSTQKVPAHVYKIWEDTLAAFIDLAEMQLQFAVLDNRHLILVSRDADRGVVYALSTCTLPVVLQDRWDGDRRFGDRRFLGEAYAMREKDGNWITPPRLDKTSIVQDKMIKIFLGAEPPRRSRSVSDDSE